MAMSTEIVVALWKEIGCVVDSEMKARGGYYVVPD